MSYRTLKVSTFENYLLEMQYPADVRETEERERAERLVQFPHAVMLELAVPELDFANRWCWQRFGPAQGECNEKYAEYRACLVDEKHSHTGKWMMNWFGKTDYDFGFAEWYFVEKADWELFCENLPNIDWGENYPKQPVARLRPD